MSGFIYLLMGGDLLVRGSVALARRFRVSPVVVAATVVGFGTSLPELVVSVRASAIGVPNLILGNVVGSNIANVLLVGGVSAMVAPLVHDDPALRRNVGFMIGAVGFFALLASLNQFGRPAGILLLAVFFGLIIATAKSTVRSAEDRDPTTPLDWVLGIPHRLSLIAVFVISGIIMLPLGAQRLVDSAVVVADRFSVPEAVVGLTILAIGTSLPELVTTVLAALEDRGDVAVGSIVGSNTFNVLAIMGVSATVSPSPIEASTRLQLFDVPVMVAASVMLGAFAWRARPIGRRLGITLVLAYVAYLVTLYVVV
ncbi:MAG: calcium/sodium antiporter [Gemmatimonadota bacterium]